MDNEIWKDIEGYEGLYQVSNMGRVKSLERIVKRDKGRWGTPTPYVKREMIMTPMVCSGYHYVYLCNEGVNKKFAVHRLVASAFLPNPDNFPNVNHKNEIKTDNRLENLEWCTTRYNLNYGTHNKRVSETLKKNGSVAGKNNPRARKVICEGVVYDCIKNCGEKYGINGCSLSGYLNNCIPMPPKWKARGLSFYDEDKEAS